MYPFLVTSASLSIISSGWWLTLFVIVAAVFSVMVYRYTLPPASPVKRSLLATLRGSAIALVILMLFEPVLAYLSERNEKPVVLMLLDGSLSMSLEAHGRARESAVRAFVESTTVRELKNRTTLKTFVFSDSLQEISLDTLENVEFNGTGSDMSGAWQHAQGESRDLPVSATILISDGAYNLGENPARTASQSTSPIFTVAVGDTVPNSDVVIAEILTNEVTYRGSQVPLDVRVRSKGLPGRTGKLTLRNSAGSLLSQTEVSVVGEEFDRTFHMTFVADTPGEVRLTATLDPLSGETLVDNNSRSVIVRVLENKSLVLLMSGPPTADLAILRQTLEVDTSLDVRTFVDLGNGRYLARNSGPSGEELREADLVVLLNYPPRTVIPQDVELIHREIRERKIPVMLFAGPDLDASRLQYLSDIVPVSMAKQSIARERVFLRGATGHPALSGRSPLPVEWSDLPPCVGGIGNFNVQSSAQVVVKLSRESLGIVEDEPAIAIWSAAGFRGVTVLCWNTSRWKLQLAASGSGGSFYESLVARLTSWLIAPAEAKRVVIKTNKKLFSGGEGVSFAAQVYGAELLPRDDAVIEIKVKSGDRAELVPLRVRGNGRYEAEFTPWSNGDYTFEGVAIAGHDTIGQDNGLFTVEAFNIELVETQARFDILRKIAEVSGGIFVPIENSGILLDSLDLRTKSIEVKHEVTLWNKATMLWVIIALLATEWIVRKRSGML